MTTDPATTTRLEFILKVGMAITQQQMELLRRDTAHAIMIVVTSILQPNPARDWLCLTSEVTEDHRELTTTPREILWLVSAEQSQSVPGSTPTGKRNRKSKM